MNRGLPCLLACAFLLFITSGLSSVNAQNYTCSMIESVSEINFVENNASNFVIFAEDSHNDNLINRQYVFDYLVSVNKYGYNQLVLEAGVAYEYVSRLNDTIAISGLVGPQNYSFLKKTLLYNQENKDTPINIRGIDVETYPPFALSVLDFILDKYASKPNELNMLHLAIEKISLIIAKEGQSDSIKELSIKIKQYQPKSAGVLSKTDSTYFFKISDNLRVGALFNFKDWGLREKHIFQNIELINNESDRKSVILIGSQHVDKKVYRNTPTFYTMMLKNGILNPETDSAPIIIFKKGENTPERLGLYKIPKRDKKYMIEYITQNSGLNYCSSTKIDKPTIGYLFYEQ